MSKRTIYRDAQALCAAGVPLVLIPPTPIGSQSQIAIFRDSEGNRVGPHAPPRA